MIKDFTLNMVGNTPLFRLKKLELDYNLYFEVYAKLELYNPTGSIKDRPACQILEDAFAMDKLHPGDEVVEATSGNMGIGLAHASKMMGLKCRIYMPKSASIERRKMMKMYGAEVILVDGGMKECKVEAEAYVKEHDNAFYADQFNNPSNVEAHIATANEIMNELTGDNEDWPIMPNYFIAGIGTGGTITGVASQLKDVAQGNNLPLPYIIGVEPSSSPLLTKGEAHAHKIQGIGANFVPHILDKDLIDEIVDVTDEDAYRYTRYLAKEVGLFVGISSGAALAGLMNVKDTIIPGSKVVIIFPDSGNRYLSVEGLYE